MVNIMRSNRPVCFLHISKTAGSALKAAMKESFYDLSASDVVFEHEFRKELASGKKYGFYAAHIGFECAESIGADVVTVLREPVSRIVSLYNFWHNRVPADDPGGVFAKVSSMTPEDFLSTDIKEIIPDRDNCQTYQIAKSYNVGGRKSLASESDQVILEMAIDNLRKCKVVGLVEDLDSFSRKFYEHFGREIKIGKENVSKKTELEFFYTKKGGELLERCVGLDKKLYEVVKAELL